MVFITFQGGYSGIEKYRFLKVLSENRYSLVWLAEHRELGTKRVIKGILKEAPGTLPENEARILTSLSSPHIPVVYDIEEDASRYYIIEEYIEGISLGELCSKRLLSQRELCSFFFRIASILKYLHEKPRQILYLDLKPSNIIVLEENVSLIDFGSAVRLGEGVRMYSGTETFSAPEQRNGGKLGFDTDIYALGKLLEFMLANSSVQGDNGTVLKRLALRLCSKTRAFRPSDMKAVLKLAQRAFDVENDENLTNRKVSKKHMPPKGPVTIGVLGICPGAGATHIAVSLACSLARTGNKVCMAEMNAHRDIEKLANGKKEHFRICGVDFFPNCRETGCRPFEAVNLSYAILDFGSSPKSLREFEQCDVRLLAAPCAKWREDVFGILRELRDRGANLSKWILLYNPGTGKEGQSKDDFGTMVMSFPFEPDPFLPSSEVLKLTDVIL